MKKIDSEINFETWARLDSELRKIAGNWAELMADSFSKYINRGYSANDVEKYEALSRAARLSASAFREQWKKTIGDFSQVLDIADELKQESVHFRKPDTLINHALITTRSELRQGRRLLEFCDSHEDYEKYIEIPTNTRLVIDHAVYAMYVAWNPQSRIIIPDNRPKLLQAMAFDDSLFRIVSPREFEELVAYVYECLGCKVEITKASRDFGADVLAWHGGPFGSETLIAIQVKRYAKERKVGIKSMFELHGAIAHYNADSGHIITSSDFTTQQIHLINLSKFQEELQRLFRA
jgi:hypothetical protein